MRLNHLCKPFPRPENGKRRLHPIDISIEFNGFAVGVHVHELAGESRTSSF